MFGGPPECPERAYCLRGLKRTYGLHFKAFVPLDAGGPLTLQALRAGDIGVALLFTTDPNISAHHLVVLTDDRALQPAENITPVLRRDVVAHYGTRPARAAQRGLGPPDHQRAARLWKRGLSWTGKDLSSVAEAWLRAQGLIQKGRCRCVERKHRRGGHARRPGQPAAGRRRHARPADSAARPVRPRRCRTRYPSAPPRGWSSWRVILAGTILISQQTSWLRVDDRLNTSVLRLLAGRTPWLTDVANGIKVAGSGWGATVLGLSVVALTMAFRRWRHLLVFLCSLFFLEIDRDSGSTSGCPGRAPTACRSSPAGQDTRGRRLRWRP